MIDIVLMQRNVDAYSIENITEGIRDNLSEDFNTRIFKTRYPNRGLKNIFFSMLEARKNQGDVNHVTGDTHFLVYLLKKSKTILTIHDCEMLMRDDINPLKKWVIKMLWFKLPSYRCRFLTTISQTSKDNLVKFTGIKEDKLKIIYDGVKSDFTKLNIRAEDKIRLLDNPEHKKTVLHISNMKDNKNVDRLIEAIKDLNVKFVKIGNLTTKQKELLRKYKIDCTQFIKVSEHTLIRVYNSVDCMVFPSLVEGFGLPIIEAQKCSCPIITSNCSSMPEVAGKGAYFVDPKSVKSIKKGIHKLLYDQALVNSLVELGTQNAHRFEWNKVMPEYEQLYQKIYHETRKQKI